MSGVLHPVGPEPEQTYWIRRALVIGTALLLVVLGALVANRTGSGTAASAAPPPVVVPAASSASPSAATADATPTPTASTSASAPAKKTTAEKTTTKKTTAKKTTAPKADKTAKKTTKPKPAVPTACAPAELRTTLTGKRRLEPKQHATFKLSLINGSSATCVVKVTPANFTLTIRSGSDRIWTSAHCATAVKPISTKVAAEDAVEWSMAWNGRRSAKDCKNRPEIPRAGTYIATAKLDGAKAVTYRVILHD